ncbi:MAG: VOC family protein [Myxococcales bacterium]|nr:VOC family protein [Myxococcales bacterium]
MRLHHLALRTHDIERTASFYRDAIGLREMARKLDDHGALRSIWLEADGVVIMVERRADGEAGVSPMSMELVAFSIDRAMREEFRSRLAPIEAETEFTLYARDPDGRRVAVSCYAFER